MNKRHGLGHSLLMLIGCLVPMFLLVVFVGRGSNVGGGFSWIFLLLVPLMHIFMMKGMMGGHKDEESKDVQDEEQVRH